MDISNLVNTLKQKLGMGGGPISDKDSSVFGMRDAYQRYALEAQLNGEQPLEFGEFVRQRQMRNTPVQPVGPMSDRDAQLMRQNSPGIPPAPGSDFFRR